MVHHGDVTHPEDDTTRRRRHARGPDGVAARRARDPIRVRLFGKLSVSRGGQVVHGFEGLKSQELFSYLLLYRQRPHSRGQLAELLWGDSTSAQAHKYLRQALWQLQGALDPLEDDPGERVVQVEADWICVNPQSDLWLDVAAFEHTAERSREATPPGPEDELAMTLREAVQLYRGDLLEGWFQEWCLFERERLQTLYLGMLDKLMSCCEAWQEWDSGLAYGDLVLRLDRARERTHQRMMRLHYQAGDRAGALRQYQRCVEALRLELGVGPSRRTLALYQQICADELDAPPRPLSSDPDRASDARQDPVRQLLEQLEGLRTALDSAARQVQRELDDLRRTRTRTH